MSIPSRFRHPARPFGLALGAALLVLAWSVGTSLAQSPPVAPGEVYTLTAVPSDSMGAYLTGENGMTLYYFTPDQTLGASACYDKCAANWPPFLLEGGEQAAAGVGVPGFISAITRTDGGVQVAYDGRPLYYFIGDKAAGDTTGQGKSDVWYVATVDGSVPAAPAPAGSAAPVAPGEVYTLTAVPSDSMGAYLTGENGMTLYYFTPDQTLGASACYDKCAANWPPFLLEGGEQAAAGVGVPGFISAITRTDGGVQVAYDGRPLYYFIGDKAAGDTTGQGKSDVWYVATVDGSVPAAPAPAGSAAPAP